MVVGCSYTKTQNETLQGHSTLCPYHRNFELETRNSELSTGPSADYDYEHRCAEHEHGTRNVVRAQRAVPRPP